MNEKASANVNFFASSRRRTRLRSLLYPEHAGTMLKNAPHRVIFMFGDLYRACFVSSAR
jgi:hypothetical protein